MPNKNKTEIEDLLFGYFAQELNEEQEKELLDWLQEDPSHKETLAEMSDWWATAHVPIFMTDRRSDFETFFGELTTKEQVAMQPQQCRRLFIRNIAATLLALVTIGGLSYYMGQKKEHARMIALLNQQHITSEIKTPLGTTSKVTLPDGSQAWVNAGSTLTYHYNYGKGHREVELEGEAYFEVKPDNESPFRVRSNNLDIKVLGTSFNVKSYADEEAVKVALLTGSVHIEVNPANREIMDFTLSPDRQLIFHKESNSVKITECQARDAIAWTNGLLKFENQLFPQIAKDLERKFNVQIRIESKRLTKESFSGSFSANHSLEQIFREVDMEKRYHWTYNKDIITIRDKQ